MKGTILELTNEEKGLIKSSIDLIVINLKKGVRDQYSIALNKLKEKDIYVDGLIMRCFENALCYAYKFNENSKELYTLAEYIRQQRENFQLQAMSRLGLAAI
jgi:hypothetical protein